MAVLVTGGCGYIGSAIVRRLADLNNEVIVIDDGSTGHAQAVNDVQVYKANLADIDMLNIILDKHKIDACVHTAGLTSVAASKVEPYRYFRENVTNSMQLFQVLTRNDVKKIVFSSSAAARYPEMSPYGSSKFAIEEQLKFLYKAHKLHSISLRYFNVIGATSEDHGEHHANETHLIPNAFAVAAGEKPYLEVYNEGKDIRDYVHIADVVEANIAALAQVAFMGAARVDIGTGIGLPTTSILREVSRVTKKDIPVVFREGRKEVKELVADRTTYTLYNLYNNGSFQWEPHQSIFNGVKSAWEWKQKFPKGYQS